MGRGTVESIHIASAAKKPTRDAPLNHLVGGKFVSARLTSVVFACANPASICSGSPAGP